MSGAFQNIEVERVLMPEERLRELHGASIAGLAASIAELGLLHPITVYKTPNGERLYTLIAGARRLRAVEQLGHRDIAALVIVKPDGKQDLLQAAENLYHKELSVIDRVNALSAVREHWEEANGKIRRGGDRISKVHVGPLIGEDKAFSAYVAEKFGLSGGTFKRLRSLVLRLHPDVRAEARQFPALAENQALLLKISKLDAAKQKIAIAAIRDGETPKQALAIAKAAPDRPMTHAQTLLNRLMTTWEAASEETRADFLDWVREMEKMSSDDDKRQTERRMPPYHRI